MTVDELVTYLMRRDPRARVELCDWSQRQQRPLREWTIREYAQGDTQIIVLGDTGENYWAPVGKD